MKANEISGYRSIVQLPNDNWAFVWKKKKLHLQLWRHLNQSVAYILYWENSINIVMEFLV